MKLRVKKLVGCETPCETHGDFTDNFIVNRTNNYLPSPGPLPPRHPKVVTHTYRKGLFSWNRRCGVEKRSKILLWQRLCSFCSFFQFCHVAKVAIINMYILKYINYVNIQNKYVLSCEKNCNKQRFFFFFPKFFKYAH